MERRSGPRWLVPVLFVLVALGGIGLLAGGGVGTADATAATSGTTSSATSAGGGVIVDAELRAGTVRNVSANATSPRGASGPSTPGATATQSDRAIVERVTYRLLPDRPDRVEATIAYSIPAGTDRLSFAIVGGEYDVVERQGFRPNGSDRYAWDGSSGGGYVTIRHDVTESFRTEGRGEQFVGGTGAWAIVARPQTSTRWCCRDAAAGLEYAFAVEGEGRAGDRLAVLGPHETAMRTVDGERLVLAVPDAAELATDRSAIVDSLAYASDRLRWGNRNDDVLMIAAPSEGIDWGPPGLTVGSDARIADSAAVSDRVNVWVHEYVHTRQYRDAPTAGGDAVAGNASWLVEGSAEYYPAILGLERGRIDFATVQSVLGRGANPPATDAILAEPATWESTDADYLKGALVVAVLDAELRAASGGEATFQDVMAAWSVDQTFTAADLEAALREHGGPDVAALGREYTETDATPELWDRDTHRRLFERPTARFDYRTTTGSGLALTGPYREGPLGDRAVVGETVEARVQVHNVGDAPGTYDAVLAVGGDIVANASGDLAPGETATVDLEHTFETTGDHRVVAGDEARIVTVQEPAAPTVSRLSVRPREPAVGETVTISATVANGATRPARGSVPITVDGEPLASEGVRLAPRANTTIEVETSFEATGEHEVAAGGLAVTVTARSERGPFGGVPVVLVALVGLGVAAIGGALVLLRLQLA